jgi:hypothetical protein
MNFQKFINLFKMNNNVKRLEDFNSLYDNEHLHYIMFPLDVSDRLDEVIPHYIHLHRGREINEYSHQFFEMYKSMSGGRRKYKQRTKRLKRIRRKTRKIM